jgi:hypothetical protein
VILPFNVVAPVLERSDGSVLEESSWVMYKQMLHVLEICRVDLYWMVYGMLSTGE